MPVYAAIAQFCRDQLTASSFAQFESSAKKLLLQVSSKVLSSASTDLLSDLILLWRELDGCDRTLERFTSQFISCDALHDLAELEAELQNLQTKLEQFVSVNKQLFDVVWHNDEQSEAEIALKEQHGQLLDDYFSVRNHIAERHLEWREACDHPDLRTNEQLCSTLCTSLETFKSFLHKRKLDPILHDSQLEEDTTVSLFEWHNAWKNTQQAMAPKAELKSTDLPEKLANFQQHFKRLQTSINETIYCDVTPDAWNKASVDVLSCFKYVIQERSQQVVSKCESLPLGTLSRLTNQLLGAPGSRRFFEQKLERLADTMQLADSIFLPLPKMPDSRKAVEDGALELLNQVKSQFQLALDLRDAIKTLQHRHHTSILLSDSDEEMETAEQCLENQVADKRAKLHEALIELDYSGRSLARVISAIYPSIVRKKQKFFNTFMKSMLGFDVLSPGWKLTDYKSPKTDIARTDSRHHVQHMLLPNGESVALKICNLPAEDNQEWKRVLREVKVLLKLDHPNIIKLNRVFQDKTSDMRDCLVLELPYFKLGDLEIYLRKESPDVASCRGLLKDTGLALSYLHARGLVHCDIKPSNILVSESSKGLKAILCDFDASQSTTNSPTTTLRLSPATQAVAVSRLATLGYCPPEVYFSHEKQLVKPSPKQDIYAFGLTMFRVLCYPSEIPIPQNATDYASVHLSALIDESRGSVLVERLPIDFVRRMTGPEDKRPTCDDVLCSAFFELPDHQPTLPDVLALPLHWKNSLFAGTKSKTRGHGFWLEKLGDDFAREVSCKAIYLNHTPCSVKSL